MKTVDLAVEKREKFGKGHAKRLRKTKRIPAILYGHKRESLALELSLTDLENVLKTGGGNVVLSLRISGMKKGDAPTALIKDLQVDPLTDVIRHVDFHAISLTEKIRVKVPLHEKGEAAGVKEGGVLEHVHWEIEVECLPTEIPEKIDVEIEHLKINDAIHVKDLHLPAGVVSAMDPEEVVFTVLPPMKEEVPVAAAEEAPTEPEVIGKKKEEAAEEGEAPGGKPEKTEKPEKK
jgi:large subunit ribosomal protein L25